MASEKKLIYADDLFQVLRNDYNINGANLARVKRHIDAAPAVDAVEVVHGQRLYNAHEVAVIIADLFGDSCACNFNSIDEWLPFKCELQSACPNPVGVACWEQYLKYKDRKEETLKKYGFTLEAKYKEA